MSNKKLTPGPWVKEGDDFIYHLNENGHNSFDISINRGCRCDKCKNLPTVDIEKVATKILAAPELFGALEPFANFACDEWETHGCFNCIAKRAIKKALGESK